MRSGSSAACFIEALIFTVYSLIICITSGIFGRSHCSMFDIRLCWLAYQCACIGYVNVIGIKCECAKIDTILNSLFTFFFSNVAKIFSSFIRIKSLGLCSEELSLNSIT